MKDPLEGGAAYPLTCTGSCLSYLLLQNADLSRPHPQVISKDFDLLLEFVYLRQHPLLSLLEVA